MSKPKNDKTVQIKKCQPVLNAFLLVLCVVMLLPFCWIVSTSLRLPSESFRMPPSFFPTSFFIDNYIAVFTRFPFGRFIINSLMVAIASVFLNMVVTTTAAYSFARITFKGKGIIFILFMCGLMIPVQATMIPLYIIMSKLRLVGDLRALILPAMISPLAIFLVRQMMMVIPKSYEEAAIIDGAGHFTIYWRVITPMVKPVLLVTVLQSFLGSWNNFLGPLIYLSDWNKMTLPIGLRVLNGYMGAGNISEILAGVTVSLVAPVLIYLFGQKYLMQGISLAGVKG